MRIGPLLIGMILAILWFLRIGLRRFLRLIFDYIAEMNRGLAFELLIVFVSHQHANLLRVIFEVQRIVGVCVSWEPILAVDLFTQRFELGKLLVVALLLIAHALAVSLHDLKVAVVNPDLPLEIALAR